MPLIPTSKATLQFAAPDLAQDADAAIMVRGLTLKNDGKLDEAITVFEQVFRRDPTRYDILTLLAITKAERQDYLDALALLDSSLRLAPDQVEAHNARGICLFKLHRAEASIDALRTAIHLGMPSARRNLGVVLNAVGKFEEAVAEFDLLLPEMPDDAGFHHDRSMPLYALRRYDECLSALETALRLRPGYPECFFHQAIVYLTIGDFARGWDLFEWRWRMEEARNDIRETQKRVGRKPLWLGDRVLAGKTILLHAEQGFGDTFQFLRFVPDIIAMGAKVVLQVPRGVVSLVASQNYECTVIGPDHDLPPIDLHCPLMSVAKAIQLQPHRIPAPFSYLRADPVNLSKWSDRLGPRRKPRIGLVWFGSMMGGMANLKSMAFEDILTIVRPDVEFFSLQKQGRPGDELVFQKHEMVVDLGPQIHDFSDTAAIMTLMDLIISVDTGPAHLAGALGRPLWLMLPSQPEWRWPDAQTTPWYPSARLFRQPAPGDWESVLASVRASMSEWIPSVPV